MFLQHILVYEERATASPQLRGHAAMLAAASNARLTLLKVVQFASVSAQSQFVDPLDWHIARTEAEVELNQAAEQFRQNGLQVQVAILQSSAIELVLRFLQENEINLVVVSRQDEGIDQIIHGFLKYTDIPVLIAPDPGTETVTGETAEGCYRKILVPLDGSQRAEYILSVVSVLAQLCKARLLLAHVVRWPEMPTWTPPSPEDYALNDRIVERNRAEAEKYLDQLTSRLATDTDTETRLLVGENVSKTLHELARQEDVDLIALSAHGYSGEPQWPFGSIARNLISYSSKPVLVVQDMPASVVPRERDEVPVREDKRAN